MIGATIVVPLGVGLIIFAVVGLVWLLGGSVQWYSERRLPKEAPPPKHVDRNIWERRR